MSFLSSRSTRSCPCAFMTLCERKPAGRGCDRRREEEKFPQVFLQGKAPLLEELALQLHDHAPTWKFEVSHGRIPRPQFAMQPKNSLYRRVRIHVAAGHLLAGISRYLNDIEGKFLPIIVAPDLDSLDLDHGAAV